MECAFPFIALRDGCMWWHLPLIAAASFTWISLICCSLWTAWKHHQERLRKWNEAIAAELYEMELEMWEEQEGTVDRFTSRLQQLGLRAAEVAARAKEIRKQQSERAGVSLRYLLSDEFSSLAAVRSGKVNPTFHELKTAFWLSEFPLGGDIPCSRDGRPGCALIDWIPRKDRREQTHFMSWTWKYTLEQVCSALEMFRLTSDFANADAIKSETFFLMDFFVNNQYRIIVENTASGSDNLQEVFENTLRRLGRMVVLLDTWQDPVFFQRVWCVFELHLAYLLDVKLEFLLDHTSLRSLHEKVRNDPSSIESLFSNVDTSKAYSWHMQDQDHVHTLIRETTGHEELNSHGRRHLVEMAKKVASLDSPELKILSSVDRIFAQWELEMWEEQEGTVDRFMSRLQPLGLRAAEVATRAKEIRKQQSRRAGVSLRYLLSDEFSSLAAVRSGKVNPTFVDLKEAFWLCESPLGRDIPCPRDGRPGCALVDWIPRRDRREQTHFLSWSWQYTLGEVCSALKAFLLSNHTLVPGSINFYMCFFVNNQFRIIVEREAAGSENLSEMFKQSLLRTGHMVAVLDTWQNPVYLTRVWTIYEQFLACSQGLTVTLVMPEASMNSLQGQIFKGRKGIRDITVSLSQVDSARAEAWDPTDAARVKDEIRRTVGFEDVNRHVVRAMVGWIGSVVQAQFQQLVDEEMVAENIEETELVCDRV